MNIRIIRPASLELIKAVEYYEQEQFGLGNRFWNEVDEHLKWIKLNPSVPRLRSGLYRRVNLKVFPYHIAYSVQQKEIIVWAIANSHKRPEYWKARLKRK
jgi:toxin ParE2